MIKAASPDFTKSKKNIIKDIDQILRLNEVSNGNFSKKFEKEISKFSGAKYVSTVTSGGTALELAIKSLSLKGKEIIVPSQTFIASVNAIIRNGCKPIFCEIDPLTGCIDPKKIINKINKNTGAIMFVYMFGIIPKAVLQIKKICKEKKLFLIEDAAHAHGGKIGKYKAGSIGDVGCFSFYATKILSIGEGGAVTTNDKKIYSKVEILKNHGRNKTEAIFREVSNNYRLSEIQSIVGYHQSKYLKSNLLHRNFIAKIYFNKLKKINLVQLPKINKNSLNTFWRFPLNINSKINRDKLQKKLREKWKIRITWMYEPLIHQQKIYKKKNIKLPISEKYISTLINLPTHTLISPKIAKKIVSKFILEIKSLEA